MNERQTTQCQKVYSYMKENGEITQRDAIRFGCYRLGARIFNLKERGVPIQSFRRTVINADGTKTSIAVYKLFQQEEADDGEQTV